MEFVAEVTEFYNNMETMLINAGVWTVILSTLLVFLEAIFAFLPLCVFINTNIIGAGPVLGILLSYVFTTLGSYTVFMMCRKGISRFFAKKIKKHSKAKRFMSKVSKLKFNQLVVLIAIPFTPSFFVNVGLGLSKISPKKFFYALVIGKIFVVIFWAYIGMKLIECLKNPWALLEVLGMMFVAYIIANFINKRFDLDRRL